MRLVSALAVLALTITTQNVRGQMPPPQARHDISQATQHSSIVFTQEMGYRDAARFAPSGWGVVHLGGVRSRDCATYYNRAVWQRVAAWTRPLTFAGFTAGHRFFLVTILRGRGVTLAAVCVHSITHSTRPDRRAVFRRGMQRLGTALHTLRARYGYVVVGGDWNRGWAGRARFAGFASVKTSRSTSLHGGFLDYFEWTAPRIQMQSQRVLGHTASDHDGVRAHLILRP